MKHIYTKDSQNYIHIYSSSIYWSMDLDTNRISYRYQNEDFIDFISEHFNYWVNKSDFKNIEVEIFSLLGDQIKEHDGVFIPEKVIYQFGGVLISGEKVLTQTIRINDDKITFQVDRGFDAKTVTFEEFENLDLGTIDMVEDDQGNQTIEFYPESRNLNYFMRYEDIQRMNEYLEFLLNGINEVYQKHHLPLMIKS